MYLGSTFLQHEAPGNDESNASTHGPNDATQARIRAAEDRGIGSSGRSEWTRKASQPATASGSRAPLAQEIEPTSRNPAARSTNSSEVLNQSAATNTNSPPTTTVNKMEERNPPSEKIVVKISEPLLASLRSKCDIKASVTLLGRIQGKHPGLKALTAWARETLHSSVVLLSLKADNVFEVAFDKPEGRIHALNQAELTCESASTFFSSWQPYFDVNQPHAAERLDHPVWMQIVNLSQILREDNFLREIGEQIGQVIPIDSSEAYNAKLFGPRIRLLVHDLDALPHTVVLPRIDGKGTTKFALEFSGLPNQCERCRSREHQVRHCPKKEITSRKRHATIRDQPTHQRDMEETPIIPAAVQPRQTPTPLILITPPDTDTTTEQVATVIPRSDEVVATPLPSEVGPPTPIAPQTYTTGTEEVIDIPIQIIQTYEIEFPKLPSSATTTEHRETPPTSPGPTHFVWRSKPPTSNQESPNRDSEQAETHKEDKGKGKQTNRTHDSTPITRQGYRSGRLADDFWTELNLPQTSIIPRKTLKVIPLPIVERKDNAMDYLADLKTNYPQPIAQVHISEQLAGIPWTATRVKQHIVNEVAQALYKVFVFPNPTANPLQKWKHGKWFTIWEGEKEGDQTCTLYVCIKVQDLKLKTRKGHNVGWQKLPSDIQRRIQDHSEDGIFTLADEDLL